MSELPAALRELHRIHRQLSDLRERLDRGPKQIKAAEAAVKKSEVDLAAAKETLKQARLAVDDKQLQLKQREAKLGEYQGKLLQAASNREYQLLKDQIAADQQANSVLTDEILEGLEKLEQLQAGVKTATENLAKANDELGKVKKRIEDQQQGLETEHARVTKELHACEEKLPESIRADYVRVARVRGEETLAAVEADCCGGCYQTLTPQMHDQLRLGKLVFCKACGRLLYLPE